MRLPFTKGSQMISNRLRGLLPCLLPVAALQSGTLALASALRATTETATPQPGDLPTETIAQLTGPEPSMNDTITGWLVHGTDLGSSFMYKGEIVLVFGDTFGPAGRFWRSNVLGFSSDDDPSDGVTIDRMITNSRDYAIELLPSKKVDHVEMTVIPTYGIAVDDRMFLHYMSVSHWGAPGRWDLGRAGFAYSDDDGQTWTYDDKAVWPGDTNFGQVAMEEFEGHIYIWGIPGGRYGGIRLARVAPESLLDFGAWEYWSTEGWISDIEGAEEVVPPNVGELSVRWNSYYEKWIMMYLNDPRGLIELRTSDEITGPWSDPMIAARASDYPSLYAPYMYPIWNDGPDIYFNMSLFGPYQVFLLRTRLQE